MLAQRLAKAWEAHRATAGAETGLRFTDDGLVLGADTVLAPAGASPRDVHVDPRDPRLAALLAAAHLAPPARAQLAHLAKAAARRRDGDDALAALHLALSGLAQLARPRADAHRLFLADGLLRAGASADTVRAALEPLAKFDPDQPRVPAGSGRPSGQWTSGDGGSASDASPAGNAAQPAATTAAPRAPAAQASQPLAYPPRPEVNPSTVTPAAAPRYATPYACDIAQVHCVEAALEAAHAADPEVLVSSVDLTNCRNAGIACRALSWFSHNVPGLEDGGGVIFPHGGVVLITGGMVDRYVPPLPGGRASIR